MATPPAHRYPFLDTLRGFAIAGILFVNIPDITSLWHDVDAPINLTPDSLLHAFHATITGRFMPIFMILFGMSLTFIAHSARRRGRSPWIVLTRRLAALLLIGIAHQILYSGEVLGLYATVGLLLIPAILLASPLVLLALGVTLSLLAFVFADGGVAATPGVILLGAAAARYDIPAHLEHAGRRITIAATLTALASAAALWWQWQTPEDPRSTTAGAVAGMLTAMFYILALALLWQTPARNALRAVCEPLGRTAFTFYLTATPLVLVATNLLGLEKITDLRLAAVLAIVILALQHLLATLWLSRFPYGPLEWIWRRITWWGATPKVTHAK
ncbi:DUF418 domain-containing protein [Dermatophilus congolensis]|uniref:Predicted membrane protein n=1 Tax=Dermatophilus congolensis TaxID=1863 RepID=A0A239VLN5_9MICO|nr:DUF418 domain-containing protein [Dermatophilus congolensis]MBO3129471.1 DUF418 domain-containing protein [Dermatophilus congolensis]MBO3131896.1 DUF418 domain-containing protein [Dermatophilus congolensis]MBO3133947.1 DUF418 domain-containing protein [Dermatophilus congolensis]MBO3136178.1 DUF418 domain-containing protein [Dermatophilus congolensis]MBO3138422.1 DUF418 domain-containing protein [Dermatophilus congolensis]